MNSLDNLGTPFEKHQHLTLLRTETMWRLRCNCGDNETLTLPSVTERITTYSAFVELHEIHRGTNGK